jgi:hypothetical protein
VRDTSPGRCCIGLTRFGFGRCQANCSVGWPTPYPSEDRTVRPAVTIVTKACVCNYSLREPFFCCRFRSRTPGPPPFSSMNSTHGSERG